VWRGVARSLLHEAVTSAGAREFLLLVLACSEIPILKLMKLQEYIFFSIFDNVPYFQPL
jgi:hypothetical protein